MKYPTQSPVYLETELDILGKETSKSNPDNPEMKLKPLFLCSLIVALYRHFLRYLLDYPVH